MALSQETPPINLQDDLKDYLSRRFIEVDTELRQAPVFPVRKEMPYKPQVGNVYYFGDPATHSYNPAITEQGWWGLVDLGSGPVWTQLNLDTRVTTLEEQMNIIYLISLEGVALAKTTPDSYTNGQTITAFTDISTIDPAALITADTAAGTITIGKTGWYDVACYIQAGGSNNSAWYGALLEVSVVDPRTLVMGSSEWNNSTPGMAFNLSPQMYLQAGAVLSMYAYAAAGTLDVTAAALSAAQVSN